jgi:hypothetical protein
LPGYQPYFSVGLGTPQNHPGSFDSNPTRTVQTRPAVYRTPNSEYLFSAYLPETNGVMYAMRFAQANFNGAGLPVPETDMNNWEPLEFWTPYDTIRGHKSIKNTVGAFTRVAEDTSTVPPTYTQVQPSTTTGFDSNYASDSLPFSQSSKQWKPLTNRPKTVAVLDPQARLPDLFFGTGTTYPDTNDAVAKFNFFMGLHDSNTRITNENPGLFMWGSYFIGATEQVVSEPALISGCIIVATFTPAVTNTSCNAQGDTTLYGFNPADGTLQSCLSYTAGAGAGVKTPVLKMPGVGIPSDLLVVGDTLFFATSNGGLQTEKVVVSPATSGVRSFRRLR